MTPAGAAAARGTRKSPWSPRRPRGYTLPPVADMLSPGVPPMVRPPLCRVFSVVVLIAGLAAQPAARAQLPAHRLEQLAEQAVRATGSFQPVGEGTLHTAADRRRVS